MKPPPPDDEVQITSPGKRSSIAGFLVCRQYGRFDFHAGAMATTAIGNGQ